jgi:hypothetical protein
MGKRFDEDNYKHWKDTFKFQSYDDEKAKYKNVKINMEDVMDRIDHYRKKYDEDDAFVRAVIDTHDNVVRIMFTKDLAHLTENIELVGLATMLRALRESRGEMEIWSVARPADGNWFLVRGSFNKGELANMDLHKKEPKDKEEKKTENPVTGLKKKEESAISKLNQNEKEGLDELPIKVKQKVKEKLAKGWTTEKPFPFFSDFYEESEINSVFNDKIKIYKLKATHEFFESLKDNSSRIQLRRGFCKSLVKSKNDSDITSEQEKYVNHFVRKCNQKFDGKYGLYSFD